MRSIKKIYFSFHFLRALKSLPIELKKTILEKEGAFRKDCFAPPLKTHKLSGKYKDYWSFSIGFRYRILFRFLSDDEVLFINIGDHSIYQ